MLGGLAPSGQSSRLISPLIVLPVAGPVGLGSAALADELGTDALKIVGVDADLYLTDPEKVKACVAAIQGMCETPKIGTKYRGKVKSIRDFGAFIELIPGLEGLLHVSEIDFGRVANPGDVIKEGDEVVVKVVEIDQQQGRIRLSRKAVLYMDPEELPFQEPVPPTEPPAEFRAKLEEDAERRASREL